MPDFTQDFSQGVEHLVRHKDDFGECPGICSCGGLPLETLRCSPDLFCFEGLSLGRFGALRNMLQELLDGFCTFAECLNVASFPLLTPSVGVGLYHLHGFSGEPLG